MSRAGPVWDYELSILGLFNDTFSATQIVRYNKRYDEYDCQMGR